MGCQLATVASRHSAPFDIAEAQGVFDGPCFSVNSHPKEPPCQRMASVLIHGRIRPALPACCTCGRTARGIYLPQ
jgi:hypothetical protein